MAWDKSMQRAGAGLPGLAGRYYARALGRIERGTLDVEFPDGSSQSFGDGAGPHADLRLLHPWRLLRRLLMHGALGLADGYLAGEWESSDLTGLLVLFTENEAEVAGSARPSLLARVSTRLRHARHGNTRTGSRRNIAAHYDLGNDFYRRWLDETMTYSSALFGDGPRAETDRYTLEQAQRLKYARMLELLDASPGDHVLEIGCGWGGFGRMAAGQGLDVTGLTLSTEQLAWARQAAGDTPGRQNYVYRDYRDETGQFDRIASIEMFEAVGERYWPTYFETLRRCLKPGGRAALQVITIEEAAFPAYRHNPDFIQLYIFPGGMLPTRRHLTELARSAGLTVQRMDAFGHHYAETLRLWQERFNACRASLRATGYDNYFTRMWQYYLSYCEAGFRMGRIDLVQIALERPESMA